MKKIRKRMKQAEEMAEIKDKVSIDRRSFLLGESVAIFNLLMVLEDEKVS